MKALITKISAILLIVATLGIALVSCDATITPSVLIGIKNADGVYDESIENVVLGETFQCAVQLSMFTNKSAAEEYKVVVEFTNAEVDTIGGAISNSNTINENVTAFEYTIWGSKMAEKQTLHFEAVPLSEGVVTVKVMIYDKDGLPVNPGYDKTIKIKTN